MSATRWSVVAGLAALLVGGAVSGAPVGAQAPASPASLTVQGPSAAPLRAGDVLRIVVFRNPELSGDVTVGEDGTLQHPIYSTLRVAGLPRAEVLARVREVLQRYEVDPQFVVKPLYRVSVVGEVRQPNLYAVEPGVTVAQAVAMAGGRTDQARPRAVLTRDGRRLTLDLDHPDEGVGALPAQSGDEVSVMKRRTSLTTVMSITSGALAAVTSLLLIMRAR